MIAFDCSETSSTSLTASVVRALPSPTIVDWLEQETGADALVSPIPVPLTRATLALHMQSQACLIQIKHGEDLLASAGYRVNDALSRMIVWTTSSWQRILMPVGYYAANEDGKCLVGVERRSAGAGGTAADRAPFISWSSGRVNYAVYQSILRRWCLRGGVVMPCERLTSIVQALRGLESDLSTMQPSKEVLQPIEPLYEEDTGSPLQELVIVRDWRVLLSALPGVGPSRIDALVDTFRENHIPLNGARALEWAFESPLLPRLKVPGWGDKLRQNLRQWIGLTDERDTFVVRRLDDDFVQSVHRAIKEAANSSA